MVPINFKNPIQKVHNSKFLALLILLLLMLVLTPFLDDFIQTRILLDGFLTAIFIFIISTIRLKRLQTVFAFILVLPLLIATWSTYFVEVRSLGLWTRIFGALFFGYTAFNILNIGLILVSGRWKGRNWINY